MTENEAPKSSKKLSQVKYKEDEYDVLVFIKNANLQWNHFHVLKYTKPLVEIEKIEGLGPRYQIILLDRVQGKFKADMFSAVLLDGIEMMRQYILRGVEGIIIKKFANLQLVKDDFDPIDLIDDINGLLKSGGLKVVA